MKIIVVRKCGHTENALVRAGWRDGADRVIPAALAFEQSRECRQCRDYPSPDDVLAVTAAVKTETPPPSPERIAHVAWAISELYRGREVKLSVWHPTPAPEGGFVNGADLKPLTVASMAPHPGEGTHSGVARHLQDASPEALARHLLKGAGWWREHRFFEQLAAAYEAALGSIDPSTICGPCGNER